MVTYCECYAETEIGRHCMVSLFWGDQWCRSDGDWKKDLQEGSCYKRGKRSFWWEETLMIWIEKERGRIWRCFVAAFCFLLAQQRV
jgi:hypothetical protein